MINMERKSLCTFATDYCYTEGHSGIQAFGDDARPQIHEAIADELRTVQSVTQRMSIAPMGKGHSVSAVGLYPTSKECGFYTHVDKKMKVIIIVTKRGNGSTEAIKPLLGKPRSSPSNTCQLR